MTTCEEIAAQAPGLVALEADAPERVQAEAHALGCAGCARALEQARRLLQALDGAAPPLAAPDTLRSAAEPILRELTAAESRSAGSARSPYGRYAATAAAAAIAAWALPLALARRALSGGHVLSASLGLAVVAALAAAATVATGGIFAGAFPIFSAIFALMAGEGDGMYARLGVDCALTELAAAAGAALVVGLLARRRAGAGAAADPTLLVAAAGGGALAAQAALHEGCAAASELPHLLVFHTGALMLALFLTLVAAQLLASRTTLARRNVPS